MIQGVVGRFETRLRSNRNRASRDVGHPELLGHSADGQRVFLREATSRDGWPVRDEHWSNLGDLEP
jgi:hypothetical protein